MLTISRLVNAFFRWEFNSCECLVRGDEVHPIDYANASPDVALTSLHYYFPWAIKTLLKWCTFCLVTGRRPRLDLDTRRYFEIGDREDLELRGEARRLPPAGRRALRGRPLPRLLRQPPRPRRRARARLGRARPTSTACSSTPSARPTRRTSRSGSSRTCAGWSASGCASRAPSPPGPERGSLAVVDQPDQRPEQPPRAPGHAGQRQQPVRGRARRRAWRSSCSKAIGRQRSSTTV